MTRTRNHAHWSEGAWDSPIKSPQTPFDDLTVDNAVVTDVDVKELEEYQPQGNVNIAGGIFTGLISGIANAFRRGSSSDWEEDPDNFFAPIYITAEEIITPILDQVEDSVGKISDLNDQMRSVSEEVDLKIGEQGEFVLLLDEVSNRVNLAIGEGGEVYQEIEALNQIMQDEFGPDGTVTERISNLREEMDDRLSDTGEVGLRMEDLREDLEAAREEDYRVINNRLWGEQGELNVLNEEMWNDQSDLNVALSEFHQVQLQFNDSQTGFNQRMQEFSELQGEVNEVSTSFMESQHAINVLNQEFQDYQVEATDQLEESLMRLQEAQRLQISQVSKMLTRYMNGGKDENIQISGNRIDMFGRWTGHMTYSYAHTTSKTTSRDESHTHSLSIVESAHMADTIPTQAGQRYINAPGPIQSVNYIKAEGLQVSRAYADSSFSIPARQWTSSVNLTHLVKESSEHIISGRITWTGTDKGTTYGLEVGLMIPSTGSWRLIRNIQSSEIGPTFPWGSPIASQSFITTATITESEVEAGGQLLLRAYSAGDTAARRGIRSASMDVTYIESA